MRCIIILVNGRRGSNAITKVRNRVIRRFIYMVDVIPGRNVIYKKLSYITCALIPICTFINVPPVSWERISVRRRIQERRSNVRSMGFPEERFRNIRIGTKCTLGSTFRTDSDRSAVIREKTRNETGICNIHYSVIFKHLVCREACFNPLNQNKCHYFTIYF